MHTEVFDIDDQLSILWHDTYSAIIDVVDKCFARDTEIKLIDGRSLNYIIVSCDGVIILCTSSGYIDYAEEFDDSYLYEAYRAMCSCISRDGILL